MRNGLRLYQKRKKTTSPLLNVQGGQQQGSLLPELCRMWSTRSQSTQHSIAPVVKTQVHDCTLAPLPLRTTHQRLLCLRCHAETLDTRAIVSTRIVVLMEGGMPIPTAMAMIRGVAVVQTIEKMTTKTKTMEKDGAYLGPLRTAAVGSSVR